MPILCRALRIVSLFLPLILFAGHAQAGGVPFTICEAWSNKPDAKSIYGDCNLVYRQITGGQYAPSAESITSRQPIYFQKPDGRGTVEVGVITPINITVATDAEFQQLTQNTNTQLEANKKELAAAQSAAISATETRILEALQKLPPELVQKELMNSLRKELKELVRSTIQEEVKKALESK